LFLEGGEGSIPVPRLRRPPVDQLQKELGNHEQEISVTDDEQQIMTRDEVLALLTRKAQEGSTSAMIALERALRLHGTNHGDGLDDELDLILERHSREN
jgi:hypothetical protein